MTSGGAHTSHTVLVGALAALLEVVPPGAPQLAYEHAALDDNVLGKRTEGARRRTFRYLKELYLLWSFAVQPPAAAQAACTWRISATVGAEG